MLIPPTQSAQGPLAYIAMTPATFCTPDAGFRYCLRINRFTATMNITVPAHMVVIGSGKESPGSAPAAKRPVGSLPNKTFSFTWDKPSFPGTIVAGIFQEFKSDEAGLDLHVFFKPAHQAMGATYATTAVKEFTYYVTPTGRAFDDAMCSRLR